MRRSAFGQTLLRLRKQCERLRREARREEGDRRRLLLWHAQLEAWSEGLRLIQQQQQQQQQHHNHQNHHPEQGDASSDPAGQAAAPNNFDSIDALCAQLHVEELRAAEQELLQQLSQSLDVLQISDAAAPAGAAAGPAPSGGDNWAGPSGTVVPPHDPMALLRETLDMPPVLHVAGITPQQVVGSLREFSLAMSLLLHELQAATDPAARTKVQLRMRQQMKNYLRLVLDATLSGRADIVESTSVYNLATATLNEEGAAKRAAQTAALLPLLHLSEDQQEAIAAGGALYVRLRAGLMRKRQALQERVAANESDGGAEGPAVCSSDRGPGELRGSAQGSNASGGRRRGGSSGGGRSASSSGHGGRNGSSSGGGCNGSSGGDGSHGDGSQGPSLAEQEVRVARLRLLLHKEWCLRLVVMVWFVCSLKWEQIACIMVLSWPYATRLHLLIGVILEAYEADVATAKRR